MASFRFQCVVAINNSGITSKRDVEQQSETFSRFKFVLPVEDNFREYAMLQEVHFSATGKQR
jgi:hypothetical protein